MIAGTLFGPVMGVTLSLYTITLLPVAVAQTIFALLPLIVMPLNVFIYKQKLSFQALVAALISLSGVMILIWRNEINQYFFS
jgi:drug/metabolite transporter (DMT)-like permease